MFVHAIYVFNMGVICSGRGCFYGTAAAATAAAAGVSQINAAEIMIASANSFHAHSHTPTDWNDVNGRSGALLW